MTHCTLFMLVTLAIVSMGCETHPIEYRTRPSWVRLMGGETPSSTMTPDGTEIIWIDRESPELQGFEQTVGLEQVRIRTDHEDGSIVLQNVLPMHLVVNLLECVRRSEYRVIWEQIISDDQRRWYEERGEGGYGEFLQYFQRNRKNIASMLNRMHAGKVYGDVVTDVGEFGGTVSLRRHVAYDFPLSVLQIVREGGEWKLENIR